MKSEYLNLLELDVFNEAAQQFFHIIDWLQSEGSQTLEHGEFEKLLKKEGFELLRRLFQAYLDNRAANEPRIAKVEGADGIDRNHCKRGTKRTLESEFGTLTVTRKGYNISGSRNLFPEDGRLNLPASKFSHGLQELVAIEASKSSFEETIFTISKVTAGLISKRQAQESAVLSSCDYEAFYKDRSSQNLGDNGHILVMTLDGKGVVMIPSGLREETRKRAEKKEGKEKARLTPGEKPNRKRMATVASVYTAPAFIRTADDVMALCESQNDEPPVRDRPAVQNKRVWASLSREPEQVTREVFEEAERRDPNREQDWVVLIDGDPHQLRRVQKIAKARGATLTVILDFIHVLEYLWKAALATLPGKKNALNRERWVRERAHKILQGKTGDVAGGIRRCKAYHNGSKAVRKTLETCADYFMKNIKFIKYNQYLSNGYPIATGVIEGACRHLVKDRMDITGARWGLPVGEAILKLRSIRASGDWDEYWAFHQQAELQRNHLNKYLGGKLPVAA